LLIILLFTFSSISFSQADLVSLVKKVKPSIVAIYTFNNQGHSLMQGSGFFINNQGDFITNWHVIENAHSAVIKTFEGHSYLVKEILGGSKESDLALLSVDIRNDSVQGLPISRSMPEIGERVLVMGNPLALEFSVSDGIIAAIRKIPEYSNGDVIQITAPVSPGSSGSPVMNMQGEVIAVAFYVYFHGENLNFAIPSQRVIDIINNKRPNAVSLAQLSFEDFKIFEDSAKKFSVSYPSNWEQIAQNYQNQIINGFLAPYDNQNDTFRENLNVIVETYQSPIQLDNYYQWNINQLKAFPDIQILGNYDALVSGVPSKILIYSRSQSGKNLTFSQIFLVQGNTGYILTFTAESDKYQAYQPIFQQIMDRFRLKSNF
ncbi:MAG: trypsin-like serine protease, partial [Candidatus Atribacteria bacterium]|nr:trypsin-like serine protease [Candidatus Atribacteria bacterium]